MKWALTNSTFLILFAVGLTSCRTIEEKSLAPKKMTQAEYATADSDGDGKLTKEEAATYLHREALAEFDLDDDSQISKKEWAAARPSAGEDDPAFQALDQDGDGQVTEEEAVEFLLENEAFLDPFEKLDTNDDDNLLWEEIEAGDSALFQMPFLLASKES
ncbi:MAG: hypothetical protein AAGF67_16855 [Verrucomicrobiota bacterium]